jgi:hypothetical protein
VDNQILHFQILKRPTRIFLPLFFTVRRQAASTAFFGITVQDIGVYVRHIKDCALWQLLDPFSRLIPNLHAPFNEHPQQSGIHKSRTVSSRNDTCRRTPSVVYTTASRGGTLSWRITFLNHIGHLDHALVPVDIGFKADENFHHVRWQIGAIDC